MTRTPRTRIHFAIAALCLAQACDAARGRQADTTDGTAALPALGEKIPSFAFRTGRYDTELSSKMLRGAPALIALWNPADSLGDVPMAEFDSLMSSYGRLNGIRYVVLMKAHPGDDGRLRRPWVYRAQHAAYAAEMHLVFDKSASDPERRAQYKLPAFLMIDADGRIIRKVQGLPFAVFRPILDSIKAKEALRIAQADSALADSMRTRLSAAFDAMDPLTLAVPDSLVSFAWCSDEGSPNRIVVPAAIRLLRLAAESGELNTTLEVTSVGWYTGPTCEDREEMWIEPGIAVDTVPARMYEGDGRWTISGFSANLMLVPLHSERPRLAFAATTSADMRARIDSIRAARK